MWESQRIHEIGWTKKMSPTAHSSRFLALVAVLLFTKSIKAPWKRTRRIHITKNANTSNISTTDCTGLVNDTNFRRFFARTHFFNSYCVAVFLTDAYKYQIHFFPPFVLLPLMSRPAIHTKRKWNGFQHRVDIRFAPRTVNFVASPLWMTEENADCT